MHLERVRRTAHAQGVELETDESLVDHLSNAGYRPEFGARELRRLIRSTLETELARSMLAGEIADGDRVQARWDEASQRLMLESRRDVAAGKVPRKATGSGGARRGDGQDARDERPPPRSADEQPQPGA
jgi:ATP-dependent Clp protease ATP-binding subunit ClpC